MPAIGGYLKPPASFCLQPAGFAGPCIGQSGDILFGAVGAILFPMFFKYGTNPGLQRLFCRGIIRFLNIMIVKPTPADFHHLTHQSDRIGLHLPPDEIEPQFDSFAKKAAAFFKILRSICSRLFSFRS